MARIAAVEATLTVVVGLWALVQWADIGGSTAIGECEARVVLDGRPYTGVEIQERGDFQPAATAGFASIVLCEDTGERVRVRAVDGIDPEVVLLNVERPDLVYVASGRCANVRYSTGFSRCLRERLVLRGRRFARYRVSDAPPEPLPGQIGASFTATLRTAAGARSVSVRQIDGVAVADAVSEEADPKDVWVADGRCYGNVLSCLREGG